MDIEYKHKQRKGKKTSIYDSRGREDRDREKKRRREAMKREKRERIRGGNENKEMSLKLLYIDIKKRSLR